MAIDEQRLQQATDKIEIRDAVSRSLRGLDRQDMDMLLSAYHEDARSSMAHSMAPRPIRKIVMPHMQHADIGLHMMTNCLIEVNGDKANAETSVLVIHQQAGEEDLIVGRFIDRFERRNGEWKLHIAF